MWKEENHHFFAALKISNHFECMKAFESDKTKMTSMIRVENKTIALVYKVISILR